MVCEAQTVLSPPPAVTKVISGLGSRLKVIVCVISPHPAPFVTISTVHAVGARTIWFNVPVIEYLLNDPGASPNTNPLGRGVKGSTTKLVAPSNSKVMELVPLKSIPVEQ